MAGLEWKVVDRADDTSDIVTYRAKVPGGWLVSVWGERTDDSGRGAQIPGGSNWGGGLTFLPDPMHVWANEVTDKPSTRGKHP
jgi:hypothetical protein